MHYLPAAQSVISTAGLLALVVVIIKRNSGFDHDLLSWDTTIIMVTFIFVFAGIPFLHTITVSAPITIAIIASVAAVNGHVAFQIILRLLMLVCVGSIMSYRKEVENRLSYYVTQIMDDERRKLVSETTKSEKLLYAIMPRQIAAKLKQSTGSIADTFYDVTVMFVSIHNYTSLTASLNHFEQVSLLNKIFSKFDKVCETHKLEKIKTIGATYLVVGGLPLPKANHLSAMCEMALDLQEAIQNFRAPNGEKYKIKAGVHCGKVVAGVIGIYKFSYDLWGDTVNTASRMETHSLPGQIQVTETCQKKMASRFEFTDRGFIQVKGKGVMHTYFLTKSLMKKSHSTDRLPNVMPAGNFSD
jgi:class 3 adenylate cyclase